MGGRSNSNGNANGHHVRIPSGMQRADPDSLPPQGIKTEMSLLGALLLDNRQIEPVMEIVRPEDFWRDTHQLVYQRIIKLHQEGIPPDFVTLAEDLIDLGHFQEIGGDDFLTDIRDLVDHFSATHAPAWAQWVRKNAEARDTEQVATEVIQRIRTQRDVPEDVAASLIKQLQRSMGKGEDDEEIDVAVSRPEPIDDAAFYGIAGQIVRKIEPHTEADPAALLSQFLVAIGNAAGRGPHWYTGATRHGVNLYLCVIGRTSRARKGTSWDFIRMIFRQIDPHWENDCIRNGGMVSGEGFLDVIRDARYEKVKAGNNGYQEIMVDSGVDDKRVLWLEEEFGGLLAVKGREHNNLADKIKNMWGRERDSSSSRNRPIVVTGGHVSIIGHVTMRELLSRLSVIDISGGFANRFLWIYAERKKLLPRGGGFRLQDLEPEMATIRDCLDWSSQMDWSAPISLAPDAWDLWDHLYRHLGRPRPGVMDELTARAEPLVMRLATIHAVLEKETVITRQHLEAAYAFWDYSERTLAAVFGCTAEHEAEAKILEALRAAPEGMSKQEIRRKVFSGHTTSDELGKTLAGLIRSCLIAQEPTRRSGRKVVIFKAQ